MTDTRPGYVLYIEHDNAPHNVSIHGSLYEAETALHDFAEWFFDYCGEPTPADEDLIEKFAELGEHVRIYKCGNPGTNERGIIECVEPTCIEIEPFVHPLDPIEAA
jgi:hypothetical protein